MTSPRGPVTEGVPLLPAAAFVVVWCSGYVAGPAGVTVVEPITLLGLRFLVAALVAGVVARVVHGPLRVDRSTLGRAALAGLIFNALQFGLTYLAFPQGLGATLSALLHSLSPVLTAVLAGLLLGERLGRTQVVGFVIGVVGVVVVLGPDVDEAGGTLGLTLALAGMLSLSLGTLGQRWIGMPAADGSERAGPGLMWVAFIQFAAPAPVLVVLGLVFEGTSPISDTAGAAQAVLYLAVVNSVIGLVLLGVLVQRAGASAGSSLFFLAPPVTAVMAWLAFGDTLGLREVLGLGLAVVGVGVATRSTRVRDPVAVES